MWVTPGGSISPRPAAHERLTAPSAGATQSAHRGGGSGHRVLGPLARPITRLEPTRASASPLASVPAAQPPPRYATGGGKASTHMKHQYFGDINDYRKYGLLRLLALTAQTETGVCWMLTDNDGGDEGNVRDYLTDRDVYRRYDPPLFDFLSGCVVRDGDPVINRSLHKLETEQILTRTKYFTRRLTDNLDDRNQYFTEMLRDFRDRDLIFFDPDTGLENQQPARGNAGSSKYLYLSELVDAFRQEHSLLIYQHLGQRHMPREQYIQQRVGQLFESLPVSVLFEFRTPYVVAFLAPQPRHEDFFRQRYFVINNSMWATYGQITACSHQRP